MSLEKKHDDDNIDDKINIEDKINIDDLIDDDQKDLQIQNETRFNKKDMMSLISATVEHNGLIDHCIDGFNDLLDDGIKYILTKIFAVSKVIKNENPKDKTIANYVLKFNFNNVKVNKPVHTKLKTGAEYPLFPNEAMISKLPYAGNIYVGCDVTLRAIYTNGDEEDKVVNIPSILIGALPIMVGSKACHTSYTSKVALQELREDPLDLGGYFVMGGHEYIIDMSENIRFNTDHVHLNTKPNEHIQSQSVSQPIGNFENSSSIVISYRKNGKIMIELTSQVFSRFEIPFYLLFRMFGMISDKMIMEAIVLDIDDPRTFDMQKIIEQTFTQPDPIYEMVRKEINPKMVVDLVTDKLSQNLQDSNKQYLGDVLLANLDRCVFPHISTDSSKRIDKLYYIGSLIKKLLLTHMGIIEPTDRDAYKNKRVHSAGISLTKSLKAFINTCIIHSLHIKFRNELKITTFDKITPTLIGDVFKSAINPPDLTKALTQAITTNTQTIMIKKKPVKNRVQSHALERKNQLNVIASLIICEEFTHLILDLFVFVVRMKVVLH